MVRGAPKRFGAGPRVQSHEWLRDLNPAVWAGVPAHSDRYGGRGCQPSPGDGLQVYAHTVACHHQAI